MNKTLASGLVALSLATGLTACTDFLTGGDVSNDPNNPTTATITSLMSSVQANLFLTMEADLARTSCTFMQQCSGVASQYLSVGNYTALGDGDFWFGNWASIYGGGGLIDLRTIRGRTLDPTVADSLYAGITDVLTAYLIGTAADVWGDVPFTQASQPKVFTTPVADPQLVIYDSMQARLSEAIRFMSSTGPTNIGPLGVDLVYGGDAAKWIALAHTLKARYFIHTANVRAGAYDSALVHTALGIQQGNDYAAFHTADVKQSNIWYQFFTTAGFGYMAAGKFGVDLLVNSNDPRLAELYSPIPADPTIFLGADPGQVPSSDSLSTLSDARLAPDFPQPLVTWAENELISAEANFKKGQEAPALASLTAVQTAATGDPTFTDQSLTGPALFTAIMTEKYVTDFQNIEAWSDWRRTCIPALAPAAGQPSIPLKLPIPFTERSANPNLTATDPFVPAPNNPAGCP
ncbi:MAG TPA: SusD/RagB family nutrient-binding outer membrane lipoprotein [Gemmatimonadales bacterium]|nr:SusD/RagB family nutrient-binding outer membrane lipoprotein [Gemmatimonadales bacterium]